MMIMLHPPPNFRRDGPLLPFCRLSCARTLKILLTVSKPGFDLSVFVRPHCSCAKTDQS